MGSYVLSLKRLDGAFPCFQWGRGPFLEPASCTPRPESRWRSASWCRAAGKGRLCEYPQRWVQSEVALCQSHHSLQCLALIKELSPAKIPSVTAFVCETKWAKSGITTPQEYHSNCMFILEMVGKVEDISLQWTDEVQYLFFKLFFCHYFLKLDYLQ